MNTYINQLINYALSHQMIEKDEIDYSVNLLLDLFQLNDFTRVEVQDNNIYDILDHMLDYAVENKIIENNITAKDIFDTKIMNCIMPRPHTVVQKFNHLYQNKPIEATNYFYQLSINSNYIRKSRTDKNIKFNHYYKYGDIQITINLSKPEKDPKEIAKAKLSKTTDYPKCQLCKENVGFAGDYNHAPRQTHRIIPISLNHQQYYLQYSPYVYYNEHCIVFNEKHIPMRIDHQTFVNLLNFIDLFPHYMLGSNADLPIVGGSILTHDHYQGGRHHFPIEDAKVIQEYMIDDVQVQMLYWPLSTLRLICDDKDKIIALSDKILQQWINYTDENNDISAYTNERHNTITPIARMKDNMYQMDLVLRNNRTSDEHPLGIFHPHSVHHHIKKENIGLIEVMGLAILPARLKNELEDLKLCLLDKQNIDNDPALDKHKEWYDYLRTLEYSDNTIDEFMEMELTKKFVQVLEDAGVYKMNEKGIAGFKRFVGGLQ
ncbi:MAG: UDP-glucose--hexose-1-phosphate uridylyltransferase [Erysipelotrichaceae bacterium]|nr:UDP-glucose--hexose-1-phosphate uridylyltransferase [Erysipelotrichaceae bacterium]